MMTEERAKQLTEARLARLSAAAELPGPLPLIQRERWLANALPTFQSGMHRGVAPSVGLQRLEEDCAEMFRDSAAGRRLVEAIAAELGDD